LRKAIETLTNGLFENFWKSGFEKRLADIVWQKDLEDI
jgi:hypothetical protein